MADYDLSKNYPFHQKNTIGGYRTEDITFQEFCNRKDSSVRIWFSNHPRCLDAHWHHALEIVMPVDNYYDIDCCGCHYHILENEILVIPARKIHSVHAPQTGSRFIFQFDDAAISRIPGYTKLQSLMVSCLHISQESHAHIYGHIHNLLLKIQHEYSGHEDFRELTIYAYLIRLLQIIGNNLNKCCSTSSFCQTEANTEYIQKFNDVLSYIDAYYMNPLTLEAIASHSGFSKYYFSRLFKQYTNCTFYEYLCSRRLKAAEEFLNQAGLSVTEAALMSGFSSISTFNRIFKQKKGCTPSEYRSLFSS